MRYLQVNGLTPGERFDVADQSPSYGVTLRRDAQTINLSPQIAGWLWGETD
jgi:DtxR family Mn-dependent transcriptional regulator